MDKTMTPGEKAVERVNRNAEQAYRDASYRRYRSNPDQTAARRPAAGGRNDV